uniref:Protein YIPF n=1 Tax=Phallusia mammillata TaxID=59560 RepID=A0A6F9DWJ8_9ASCI|nr:protein YIPF1 [Phallusia mammillata]
MSDPVQDFGFQTSPNEKELWEPTAQSGVTDAATLNVENDEGDMHTFTQFPDSAIDDENAETSDTSGLIDKKENPIWSFAFYQKLFDVDTNIVLNRIMGSMIPLPSKSFKSAYIGGRPDLYGPFWICATLVLVVGVCGNLTTLLTHYSDEKYHYTPQFERLSVAAIIVYSYTFVWPLLVRAILWWRKTASGFSVADIMCIYGYSIFIFIPVSFLLLIPVPWLDWLLTALAISVSGAVLLLSLWPAFRDDSRQIAVVVLLVLFACHAAMAVGLQLYFFTPLSISYAPNATESAPSKLNLDHSTSLPNPTGRSFEKNGQ